MVLSSGVAQVSPVFAYAEYKQAFQAMTEIKPAATAQDRQFLAKQCRQQPLGLMLPFTSNNIYHTMFHAVPAFEAFRADAALAKAEFVPMLYKPTRSRLGSAIVRAAGPEGGSNGRVELCLLDGGPPSRVLSVCWVTPV